MDTGWFAAIVPRRAKALAVPGFFKPGAIFSPVRGLNRQPS